jgi:hypothetical protein
MPQPTEQWVQMVRLTSALPPAAGVAASAFLTMLGDIADASAVPPAA